MADGRRQARRKRSVLVLEQSADAAADVTGHSCRGRRRCHIGRYLPSIARGCPPGLVVQVCLAAVISLA
jgi:hypothetical protein